MFGSDSDLHVLEFDRDTDGPAIKTGARLLRIDAAARVIEEQTPVFLPDVAQEMLKHPELAPCAPEVVGRSTYLFPVSTSLLAVTKERGQEFTTEDVELLRSLALHVAVALECALARDRAEHYQRELAGERDRLRLVLEINNHVAKLDINDVFRSASSSIRSYFASDFATFWLLKEETSQLQKVWHDFPDGKGFMAEVDTANLSSSSGDVTHDESARVRDQRNS